MDINDSEVIEYFERELHRLADPKRSIIADIALAKEATKVEESSSIDVYASYINKLEQEQLTEKTAQKTNKKYIKQQQKQAQKIINKMNRTDDDEEYMRLAVELEIVLDLKEEDNNDQQTRINQKPTIRSVSDFF